MPSPVEALKETLLASPHLTACAAESLTAGLVQARIASVSGASGFFLGGLTAYTVAQKVALLGVSADEARACDGVSAAVAGQMACGALRLFGADLAVATTGYAEPDSAKGVEEPYAFWAVAHRYSPTGFDVHTGRIVCPGMSRNDARACVADAALAELAARAALLRQPESARARASGSETGGSQAKA